MTDTDLQQIRDALESSGRIATSHGLPRDYFDHALVALDRVGERIRELERLVAKSGNSAPDVRADAASETVWLGRRSPEHPWIVLTEQVAAGTRWEVREVTLD